MVKLIDKLIESATERIESYNGATLNVEKFTELVVLECIECIQKRSDELVTNSVIKIALNTVIRDIKQKFGIEQ